MDLNLGCDLDIGVGLAGKKTSKKTKQPVKKQAAARPEKPVAKLAGPAEPAPEKPGAAKAALTPALRVAWIKLRRAWGANYPSFSYALSQLSPKDAEGLYNIVRLALYTDSYGEAVQKHPELRELLRNEQDRMCMIDIYEVLSWKLGRSEPAPADRRITRGIRKGAIGRNALNMP